MHQSLNLWKISQCKQLTLSLLWARTLGPSLYLSSLLSAELFLANSFSLPKVTCVFLPSHSIEYPEASPLGLGDYLFCVVQQRVIILSLRHILLLLSPFLYQLSLLLAENQESVLRV